MVDYGGVSVLVGSTLLCVLLLAGELQGGRSRRSDHDAKDVQGSIHLQDATQN